MRTSRILAALALSATLLLGACSSDKAADTTAIAETTEVAETAAAETTTVDTEALETTVADTVAAETAAAGQGEPDAFATSIAKSFQDSTGTELTPEQSTCVGDAVLSAFTAKELIALGSAEGGFDALPDTDKAKAVASFQKCPGVLEEAFFAGFKQSLPGLDENQGRCGATAIGKAFTPEELVRLSSEPTAAQEPATLTKVFKAFESCDGLLRSLFATGIKQSGGLTDTQADCAADAMIRELGIDALVKLSSDPSSVDPAVQTKLVEAMSACTKP